MHDWHEDVAAIGEAAVLRETGRQRTLRVSVIIPTHNRAHIVGEAIESVLAQTYQDFEIIVVDDASTDNTPEVLADYAARNSSKHFDCLDWK